MENNKGVKPIPDVTVEFAENKLVDDELAKLTKNKNPNPPKKIEDQFYVHIPNSDTRISKSEKNFSHLKWYKNLILKVDKDKPRTLLIKDLPKNFNEKSLFMYFKQFGNIVRVSVNRDKITGRSSSMGYVEFGSHDVAKLISTEFQRDPLLYDANKINVKLIQNNKNDEIFNSPSESQRLIDLYENFDIHENKRINDIVNKSYFDRNRTWRVEEKKKYDNERNEMLKMNEKKIVECGIKYKYNGIKRNREGNLKIKESAKKKRKME